MNAKYQMIAEELRAGIREEILSGRVLEEASPDAVSVIFFQGFQEENDRKYTVFAYIREINWTFLIEFSINDCFNSRRTTSSNHCLQN